MTTKRRQASASAAAVKPNKSAPKSKHYTRPGVEAAARLISLQPTSDHVDKWERASSYYAAMIKAKGGMKLVKLDKQRSDLTKTWTKKSSSGMMTKEQLLNIIIEWKFAKGKPRNALKPMLKSNSDASVTTASKRAFETANGIPKNDTSDGKYNDQLKSAINELCELKGVGPATASAILSLYRPDIFAFMDDELIECLYDGKRGYTLKIYLAVNEKCREIAKELNEAEDKSDEDGSSEWTPCRVGKALWTLATMSATNDEDGLSAIFSEDNDDSLSSSQRGKRAKKG